MATHIRVPTRISAAGTKPKIIEEFIGRVNSNTIGVSIARMKSPSGWEEPAQTPEFDEVELEVSLESMKAAQYLAALLLEE